jgi:hypothetical protein
MQQLSLIPDKLISPKQRKVPLAILRTELGRYHSQGAKFLEVRM